MRPALSMVVVGVLSTLVLVSLPIFVGGMVAQFPGDDRYVGWFGSADMTGSAVACLWTMTRIARVDWRRYARRAIGLVIVGNLASIAVQVHLGALLAARAVTGFGNGVVLSIVFTGLCHARDTERLFGLYTFAQLVLQALALAVAPRVIDALGMTGFYVALAGAAGACAALIRFFPERLAVWQETVPHDAPNADGAEAPLGTVISDPRTVAGLLAQGVFFLAPGAVWAYLERIGVQFSLSMSEVGNALATASVAGLAGSAAVIALGARLGNLAPMVAATLASVIAMQMLIGGSGLPVYVAATCLFTFAWNFTFPYQMSLLSRLDTTGAVATLSLLVQLCALAIGPLLAAALLGAGGYRTVLTTCNAAYLVSLALFAVGSRRTRQPVDQHG